MRLTRASTSEVPQMQSVEYIATNMERSAGRRGGKGGSRMRSGKVSTAQPDFSIPSTNDTNEGQHENRHQPGKGASPRSSPSLARAGGGRRSRGQRVYQDYFKEEDAKKGLQDGSLFQGKLRINTRRRSTAFVTADGGVLPSDIFLQNEKARNRAQEGDLVVVKLSPVTEWIPLKQAYTRPLNGLVDAIGDLSVADIVHGDEVNEEGGHFSTPELAESKIHKRPDSKEPPGNNCLACPEQEKETRSGAASEIELWRPSQKVMGGGNFNGQDDSLCPEGILASQGNLQPAGKVVFILKENHREEHMGCLVVSSPMKQDGKLSDRDSYVMFHPADRRVPHMLIARGDLPSLFLDNPAAYANSIFMARLKSTWSQSSKLPWGERVRFVGEARAIQAETEALLAQHGVDHGDFPNTVLRALKAFLPETNADGVDAGACVRGSRWKIPDEEIARRRDLRKQRIFTIDPTTARDLDDALSVTPLDDGGVEIGVHIADVTYFLQPNSDLDREARRRGTTVYLVQQAIPMLPPLLCEELCSLNPGVDRLTYSCTWKMNIDGTLVDEPAWFGRTVIRSCSKLDYNTAQLIIDGLVRPGDPSSITPELWDVSRRPQGFTCDEVCQDVLLLHALAKERRAKRFQSGALSLNTPKLTFKLNHDGNPVEFGSYPIRDSNKLVEEYMLLANFLVAQQTVNVAGDQAFLRMHPPPLAKGLDTLRKTLAGIGINLDTKSSASLHASLKRIRSEVDDEDVVQVLTMMATVPMQNAEYVAAGKADSWRHYALNIPIYTHFTSPIRRYADVMVHRILTATLDGASGVKKSYDMEAIAHTAAHCNEKRMAAKMAQERCDQVYLAVFLQSKPTEAEAVVISLGEQSFTVNVPKLGLTCRIYVDKIPDVNATYDEMEEVLLLQAASTVTHTWTTARIIILSKILVRCTVAEKAGPIDIQVEFMRPVNCS